MLSFANTHLSFYFLFLLVCVANLVASAPTHNSNHRHNLQSRPFPYGKLADKLLHVNDRNYDVSYMIDDINEDMVRVYPENHHSVEFVPFSSGLPIASFESTKLLPVPKVGDIKNLFSFAYQHIPHIIKKVVVQEWDATVVWWQTMARDQ
jgi:hypothetical protein